MNYKLLFTTLFLLLIVVSPTLAAFSYEIAGITISDKTTAAELIVYFFNIGIMIGSFLAVVMVLTSGFDYLTSSGNVSKLESAKKRLQNSTLGMVVLLGAYIILSSINPQLLTVKIDKLECSEGIVLTTSNGRVCVAKSTENITYKISSSSEWLFPANSVYKAYAYTEPNYGGTITEVPFGGSIPDGTKSIWIVEDNDGLYLFDYDNLKPGASTPYPRFINKSIKNLQEYGLDNKIGSIDLHNKDIKNIYQGILFTDPGNSGKCSYIRSGIPDLSINYKGYYLPAIGKDTLSSIIVFKVSNSTEEKGAVNFYKAKNCQKGFEINVDEDGKVKPIIANSQGMEGDFNLVGDTVLSFDLSGSIGLVIRSNKGSCLYRDLNSEDLRGGNCLGSLEGTDVLPNGVGAEWPEQWFIFPLD